jgi:hypothetical protein
MNKYVQFGCGLCAPLSWRNFDASPTLRLQKVPLLRRFFMNEKYPIFPKNVEYGNIVKGLPVNKESCRAIFCSHVLEHLSLNDFRVAIKNTYLYLEKGGLFRFIVPDLEKLAREYINSNEVNASYQFMEKTRLGKRTRESNMMGFLREFLGNSHHLWMWDFKSLNHELQDVGFIEIRPAEFGDSEEPLFKDVEDKNRWIDSLCIQCKK